MVSARWIVMGMTVVATGLMIWAEDPLRLDGAAVESPPPPERTDVSLPPAATEPEPDPVPEAPTPDALAALAPESFAADSSLLDQGFGTTFGSGGAGPGIVGGGGFGSGAQALTQDRSDLDRPAKVLSRPPLEYPHEARSRGIQGHVTLKIQVGPNGLVETVRIAESEPPGFFDEAALRAVRSWKFEPAVIQGKVAMSWTTQRIRFEMDGGSR